MNLVLPELANSTDGFGAAGLVSQSLIIGVDEAQLGLISERAATEL